ncbi:nuclear transport factor 2 family protein [Sphingobium phenoxybenzoativorans]|jgi:ketosteroid isomerase-like protein|uniref:Nuclear transport factor 2 family protein n=1 Tax=Sphingobium phenoxybenzoativorans TaxID=1592790 RepID=A0A975K9B0_9SPHN|nr:nuclear transport factor 2 family protein [Sphingobium phenoxybenzoativorans]QUT07191.1 nuclear transport factor 2 family protein [Sphingobium phenoxybenzoativorans]
MSAVETPQTIFFELERRRLAAARAGDIAALAQLLHDDFMFIHSNGRIDGRDDYLQLLASGNLTYREMDGTDHHLVHANADMGIVRSRVSLIADYRGTRITVTALVVAVWIFTVSQWRAVTTQSTTIP